jgi:transposase
MKEGLLGDRLRVSPKATTKEATAMLHVGLDLSRDRLDFHLLDGQGHTLGVGVAAPDAAGLARFAVGLRRAYAEPIMAAIESMTGARFVHDQLERFGFEVEIADARKAKGLAPLACKTDRIDAWVLAELSRRELVPAIWLPDPGVRAERERARFRLFLVGKRSSLKARIHQTLISFGHSCPVSDLFGASGRALLERLALPDPWQGSLAASLILIDEYDRQIAAAERELRHLGVDHRYVPLLMTCPGIAWVLAYTIAAEIGEIARFPSPAKLVSYTGLCPRIYQSGGSDRRGPISKRGPKYLRWALIEATTHACRHPAYRQRHERTRARLGKQRGPRVAQVDTARRLAHAIWHMLTRNQPFAPASAPSVLAA